MGAISFELQTASKWRSQHIPLIICCFDVCVILLPLLAAASAAD